MSFFKQKKYNVQRAAKNIRQKTMISSPLFEENNIKAGNNFKDETLLLSVPISSAPINFYQ